MVKYVFLLAGVLLSSISFAQGAQLIKKDTTRSITIKTIPSQFYTRHSGFFCKQELQFQKRTGLNLFIRLGTKEYVDYLEQKPYVGSRKP